jgi:hypothetical protein
MAVRLLEVFVEAIEPTRWRWRVVHEETELKGGYATTRETAQIEGDSALFALIAYSTPLRGAGLAT